MRRVGGNASACVQLRRLVLLMLVLVLGPCLLVWHRSVHLAVLLLMVMLWLLLLWLKLRRLRRH